MPPEEAIGADLAAALEELRLLTQACTLFLVRTPAPAGVQGSTNLPARDARVVFQCPAANEAAPSTGVLADLERWPLLPEAGDDFGRMSCTLATGEILMLWLDFDGTPAELTRRAELRSPLARPLLNWAKYALDHSGVEARFQATLSGQEEEREWLAYELHDVVAETLVPAFHQLQTVETSVRANPEAHRGVTRGSVLLREAIREIRAIMNDLHPPLLDSLGLVPLVEDQLERLEQDLGLRVERHLNYVDHLPKDLELIVYRILSEALINIRRHAQPTAVTVTLSCQRPLVQLIIEDNGVGFDVASALAKPRIGGLMSMRRRAELAGGTCVVDSQRHRGTRVSLLIPVHTEG